MTYKTKKRITKVAIRKTYALLFSLIISAGVIGWNYTRLMIDIDRIITPQEVHAEIKKIEIEKDIIIYFFEEAEKEGLTKSEIVKLLETIRKESNFEQYAIGYNAKSNSWDLGYWQINTKFHPEVSRECSFNTICSTKEAIRIYKEKGLSEWSSNK